MKKILSSYKIVLMILIFSMLLVVPATVFTIINKIPTEDKSYASFEEYEKTKTARIYDLAGLKTFRDYVNSGKTYDGWTIRLMNDIENVGDFGDPIGMEGKSYFSGTFDGNLCSISGITDFMSSEPYELAFSDDRYVFGLFGRVYEGEIHYLHIKDSTITINPGHGSDFEGGILANIMVKSTITNCAITNVTLKLVLDNTDKLPLVGHDNSNDYLFHCGLLVGHCSGEIKNCTVNKSIYIEFYTY